MYETVETINGYRITRMVGTHGCYHVAINEHVEHIFDTIKKAEKWLEIYTTTGDATLATIYSQQAIKHRRERR